MTLNRQEWISPSSYRGHCEPQFRTYELVCSTDTCLS